MSQRFTIVPLGIGSGQNASHFLEAIQKTASKDDSEDHTVMSGVLLDFVRRLQAASRDRLHDALDDLQEQGGLNRSQFLPNVSKSSGSSALRSKMPDDQVGLQYTYLLMEREKLLYSLDSSLAYFWKARKHPNWSVDTKTLWKKRAVEIVDNHYLAKCIRVDVEAIVAKNGKLLLTQTGSAKDKAEKEPEEHLDSHMKRRREFFSEYRASFWNSIKSSPTASSPSKASPTKSFPSTPPTKNLGRETRSPTGLETQGMVSPSPSQWRPTSGSSSKRRLLGSCPERYPENGTWLYPDERSRAQYPRSLPAPKHILASSSLPDLHATLPEKRVPVVPSKNSWLPPLELDSREPSSPERLSLRYRRPHRSRGALAPRTVWQPPTTGDQGRESVQQFLHMCEERKIVPKPMPFVTGHSIRVTAWDKLIADDDLLAITSMMASIESIADVDLEGNTLLTDRSLIPFLQAVRDHPACAGLKQLVLKRCSQAGERTIEKLVELLLPQDLQIRLSLSGSALQPRIGASLEHSPEGEALCIGPVKGGLLAKWNCENPMKVVREGDRLIEANGTRGDSQKIQDAIWKSSAQLSLKVLRASEGARTLSLLDLSGVTMAGRCHIALCEAIRMHTALWKVLLADVGLGNSSNPRQCIFDLMACRTIEELDISWNSFDAELFTYLGQQVVERQRLRSLSVANCSVALNVETGDVPIMRFLESLSGDATLTHLNASLNRIDFCGALVLEDALERHKQLTSIDLSHNPLGVLGVRSVLRLVARDWSGLMFPKLEGCTKGWTTDIIGSRAHTTEANVFDLSNPNGYYALDLSRTYHRALLRILYKSADRLGLLPEDAFSEIEFSIPPYSHPARDPNNLRAPRIVRNEGKLKFTFSIAKGLDSLLGSMDESDAITFLDKHFSVLRLRPSIRKVAPILAQIQIRTCHHDEQICFLDALSRDFVITYPQMLELCTMRALAGDAVSRLVHCIDGGQSIRYLTLLRLPTFGTFLRVYKHITHFLNFNAENPTGHYRLNLASGCDHAVAEELLLLDTWEAAAAKRKGRPAVSQKGDYTQIRNAHYQGHGLPVAVIAQWHLPCQDMFECDYVSGRRPPLPPESEAVGMMTFNDMLRSLQSSTARVKDQIEVLRLVSHHFYITSHQMRTLIGLFPEDPPDARPDAFVFLFFRVVDIQNEKVFRVRFAEKEDELKRLRYRMGHMTLFPFVQPEQSYFELDTTIHDQRLVAAMVVSLAMKENEGNMREYSFIHSDGKIDPLPTGIPRSWVESKHLPDGIFKVHYVCAPEERNLALRVKFLKQYGFWEHTIAEPDVDWWAALTEAPDDALEFLEFIIYHYDDVYQAFDKIAGEDGELNLQEFTAGMATIHCDKFRRKVVQRDAGKASLAVGSPHQASNLSEQKRIENLFRYLDPSDGGTVSRKEWSVLDNLFKEMDLSIREFVEFLQRTFTEKDGRASVLTPCSGWLETPRDAGHQMGNERMSTCKEDEEDDDDDDVDNESVADQDVTFRPLGLHQRKTQEEEEDWHEPKPKMSRKTMIRSTLAARRHDPHHDDGDKPFMLLPDASYFLPDFLERAWDFINDDGSEEIDLAEWELAVRTKLRYFGPSEIIFSFLDKDDEGTLSKLEFHALAMFED